MAGGPGTTSTSSPDSPLNQNIDAPGSLGGDIADPSLPSWANSLPQYQAQYQTGQPAAATPSAPWGGTGGAPLGTSWADPAHGYPSPTKVEQWGNSVQQARSAQEQGYPQPPIDPVSNQRYPSSGGWHNTANQPYGGWDLSKWPSQQPRNEYGVPIDAPQTFGAPPASTPTDPTSNPGGTETYPPWTPNAGGGVVMPHIGQAVEGNTQPSKGATGGTPSTGGNTQPSKGATGGNSQTGGNGLGDIPNDFPVPYGQDPLAGYDPYPNGKPWDMPATSMGNTQPSKGATGTGGNTQPSKGATGGYL